MGVPRTYRKSREKAIASYDFTDIANGEGVVVYYGCKNDDEFFLTSKEIPSKLAWTHSTVSNGEIFNEDMDLKFNTPQKMKGNLIASIPLLYITGNSKTLTAIITISHFDGSSATQIGQETDTTITGSASLPIPSRFLCIEIADLNQHFKKGESLRINITVSTDGNDSAAKYVGHDPIGRSGDGSSGNEILETKMRFYVPFDLDL
tara:strand:- start:57 stop:671 length:615 start_codon:yes stop_codon:yes gene_type:complete